MDPHSDFGGILDIFLYCLFFVCLFVFFFFEFLEPLWLFFLSNPMFLRDFF